MKVYQVVECTGSYEDYHEHVEGTYLDKAKAESKVKELEEQRDKLVVEYDECCDCEDYNRSCYLGEDGYCENCTLYCDEMDAHYRIDEHEVIE